MIWKFGSRIWRSEVQFYMRTQIFLLCPTLVTRRKKTFSIFSPSSKLTIILFNNINWINIKILKLLAAQTLKNQGLKAVFFLFCFALFHTFIFNNFLGQELVSASCMLLGIWYGCKSQCVLNLSYFRNNASIHNVFYTLTCPPNSV